MVNSEKARLILTDRFAQALAYAARVHREQTRKGTAIPYASRLLSVAAIALENGGDEDEAIAALLHDAPEDQGGQRRLADIRWRFGHRVADIVEACSDALTEDPDATPEWRERKAAYHRHLTACTDPSVHLVSAADKLHNARSTAADLRRHGPAVWTRFNAGRDASLWNYQELIAAYLAHPIDPRVAAVVAALREAVGDLHS